MEQVVVLSHGDQNQRSFQLLLLPKYLTLFKVFQAFRQNKDENGCNSSVEGKEEHFVCLKLSETVVLWDETYNLNASGQEERILIGCISPHRPLSNYFCSSNDNITPPFSFLRVSTLRSTCYSLIPWTKNKL
jgi:hypothetical protein